MRFVPHHILPDFAVIASTSNNQRRHARFMDQIEHDLPEDTGLLPEFSAHQAAYFFAATGFFAATFSWWPRPSWWRSCLPSS